MRPIVPVVAGTFAALILAGCQTPPPPAPAPAPVAAAPPAPPPAPTPPPAPPPIRVLPFDDAVVAAANTLLSGAAQQTKERRVLVIDPLIDAVSGMESAQTRVMEKRIVELAKEKFPQFDVQPFSVSSVAKLPIVLVGTFTPIDAKNQVRTTREQFRIQIIDRPGIRIPVPLKPWYPRPHANPRLEARWQWRPEWDNTPMPP